MHFLPYSWCPWGTAKAGRGGKVQLILAFRESSILLILLSSHAVFLLLHLSQIKPCYPLLNVITVNEALSNSRLLHHVRALQKSYRNQSSMSQGQKCCQEARTITFVSSILIKQRHLSKLISERSLLSEVIWWPQRAENPIPWIVKCTFGYL